jgi:hypothetical protein
MTGRSLAARSISAGGRCLGASRERCELTRGNAMGMHELDVQVERLGIFGFGLAVHWMPLQADGRLRGESFGG